MIKKIGVQYTLFKRGAGFRQVYYNVLAPPNLDTFSDKRLVDYVSDVIKDMHPGDMIMIDAINRNGPVDKIHDFEAKK